MAGIKNINVVSGTGNPVQMQDLQNLWSAINSLLRSTKTPISIIAGFATANNNTGTNIGEGIICYQGQAYYLPTNTAKIGQYLYANTIQDEQRVYEDGTTRYTYQDYVVNAAANASASGIGTLIGQATAANLAAWKVGVIADGSIRGDMLADGAVTTVKIADGAIIDKKIANYAVGTNAIQNNAINASKIVDRAVGNTKIGLKVINSTNIADGGISTENIAAKAITTDILADNSVTTNKIVDRSVTGAKIAEGTISGIKIKDGSIPESKMTAPGVLYLEPTPMVPHAMLSNYKLNIIKIGNMDGSHVNAVMPVQQLPGTPIRIFIEHPFSGDAVVDIRLTIVGEVVGTINISSAARDMYAEIFVYDGRVSYWVSGSGYFQVNPPIVLPERIG